MTQRSQPADDAGSRDTSWKHWLFNGVVCAIFAMALCIGALRAFVPSPEEPESRNAAFQEELEDGKRSVAEQQERLRIMAAIAERRRSLEAVRVEMQLQEQDDERRRRQVDELDEEIRRLDKTRLAEMENSARLLRYELDAAAERRLQRQAKRQERIAKQAWGWQHYRTELLATGACAWVLAGWMLVKATVLHRRQHEAEAVAEKSTRAGTGTAVVVAARPASTDAGAPSTL